MAKNTVESRDISRWGERIALAKKRRDTASTDNHWETYIDEYKNIYNVSLGSIKAPIINEVYAYVQSSISSLYFRDPKITINPKKKGTKEGAFLIEQAINYYWRELNIKEEMEHEIMDAILVGHAWHKSGMTIETWGESDNLKVVREDLYSKRVGWRDMVFNLGSLNPPRDCLWMAQRIIKPLDEIKQKYSGTGSLQGVPHPLIADEKQYKKIQFKDDVNFVILWEIWDVVKREVKLIAENHDRYLAEKKWPDYLESYPFDLLWFNRTPDDPYPMSDIAPWNDQIKEKIKLMGMALNHVKRWNRQMLVKGDLMTDSDLDKFEQGVDGAVLKVNTDPNAGVRFTDFGNLPTDIYNLLRVIDQIARTVNGQPEIDKGGVTQTQTRTLGELELIKAGAKSRMDRKIDRIETHIEGVAKQMIAHMQANFDLKKIVKITGTAPVEILKSLASHVNPDTMEIEYTKDDIVGEYEIDVKAGSTLPLNKEGKTAILGLILQSLAPAVEAAKASPFIHELVMGILENYDMPQLREAFEKEMILAEEQMRAQAQSANLQEAKTYSETAKREAQAHQIDTETMAIRQQMRKDGINQAATEAIRQAQDAAMAISGDNE